MSESDKPIWVPPSTVAGRAASVLRASGCGLFVAYVVQVTVSAKPYLTGFSACKEGFVNFAGGAFTNLLCDHWQESAQNILVEYSGLLALSVICFAIAWIISPKDLSEAS